MFQVHIEWIQWPVALTLSLLMRNLLLHYINVLYLLSFMLLVYGFSSLSCLLLRRLLLSHFKWSLVCHMCMIIFFPSSSFTYLQLYANKYCCISCSTSVNPISVDHFSLTHANHYINHIYIQ